MDEYLSDGLGAKNKREIDILIMNLLMKYGDLAAKSNQELSILLQATESKVKSLRYEARLKYPPDADYVKREFFYILSKAQYAIETGKIVFAIEDSYIRHALQGQLKAKGMFADTSFNTELIKIDTKFLEAVLGELYNKGIAKDFHDGFKAMESQMNEKGFDVVGAFSDFIIGFVKAAAQKIALDLAMGRLGF
ncbi:MAG: hypothetical protein IH589_05185 [Anaerolineales bacterium]|nr:hypothetical protein [Anaerolineales bacterium]